MSIVLATLSPEGDATLKGAMTADYDFPANHDRSGMEQTEAGPDCCLPGNVRARQGVIQLLDDGPEQRSSSARGVRHSVQELACSAKRQEVEQRTQSPIVLPGPQQAANPSWHVAIVAAAGSLNLGFPSIARWRSPVPARRDRHPESGVA